jgi:hypothetical protein
LKSLILIFAFISSNAFADTKSPAEVISEFARDCHNIVGVQVSLSLSQKFHNARPGSPAERQAKKALDAFNEQFSAFVAFETGCNETLGGDSKFVCYSQGYARETKRIAQVYTAMVLVDTTPECAYLKSAR